MATEERWVGVEDVAAHLGVAKDSVYRWIEERGLPAHRVGRLFRFKLSEVDDWVRQDSEHSQNPNSAKRKSSSKSRKKPGTKNRSRKRSGNE